MARISVSEFCRLHDLRMADFVANGCEHSDNFDNQYPWFNDHNLNCAYGAIEETADNHPDFIIEWTPFVGPHRVYSYSEETSTPLVFTHATGRHYDFAQVLEIVAEIGEYDEWDLAECVATFDDKSRYIKGRVTFTASRGDSNAAMGRAVLAAYDRGAYELI